MRNIYPLLFLTAALFASCKPEKNPVPPAEPAVKYVTKIATAENEYREYVYNSEKQVSKYHVQFISGSGVTRLTTEFSYVNGIINTAASQAGSIFYDTEGSRVITVRSFRPRGSEISVINFLYYPNGLVSECLEKISQPDPGSPVETKQTYEYYTDGNLKRINYYLRYNRFDPFELTGYTVFAEYDRAKNPDKFFSSMIFLPTVVFQKNNPLRIVHYSPAGSVNQENTFVYTYDAAGYPLTKRMFDSRTAVSILFTYTY
jgi:hypothetical protein